MANEPDPAQRNASGVKSYSLEDQLNTFRKKLDGLDGLPDTRIILPGFLFRSGLDHKYEPIHISDWQRKIESADELSRMAKANERLATIDWDLLEKHAKTYRLGLDTFLAKIRPVEIVKVVSEIWGGGTVTQTELGANVTYEYPTATEEKVNYESTTERHSYIAGIRNYRSETSYYARLTGRWLSKPHSVSESITIDFGNKAFPWPESIKTSAVDEFFAESYYAANADFCLDDFKINNGSPVRSTHNLEHFRGVPRTIWRRPDNLGVRVTIPYAVLHTGDSGQPYKRDVNAIAWFDHYTSQQEIVGYLAEKLEAQRTLGILPSQIEAVELAKIEELRKRGLYIEPKK